MVIFINWHDNNAPNSYYQRNLFLEFIGSLSYIHMMQNKHMKTKTLSTYSYVAY